MFVRLLAPVFYTCGGSGLFAIRFRGHVFFVAFYLSFIFRFRRLSLTGFIIVPIGGLLAFAFGLIVAIVTILIYFPLLVFRSIFKYLIFGGMIE